MMVFYCFYLLRLFSVSFMSGVIDVITGVIIWVMFAVVIVIVKFVIVIVVDSIVSI